jgi:hypothetical protein
MCLLMNVGNAICEVREFKVTSEYSEEVEFYIKPVKSKTQRRFKMLVTFDGITCSKDPAYNGSTLVGLCGGKYVFVAFLGGHKLPRAMESYLELVHRLCGTSIYLEVLSDLGEVRIR